MFKKIINQIKFHLYRTLYYLLTWKESDIVIRNQIGTQREMCVFIKDRWHEELDLPFI